MSSPIKGMPTGNLTSSSSKVPTFEWLKFFQDTHDHLKNITTSGTTANRPTTGLFVGLHYFDTTLGFEIHYNGTQWVKYDGTAA